ncbi:MAG: hypothetical protein HY805_10080 [Nitrospirae bacterium]|nr:hypothetical protein [Nitrospirota bacterium]
MKRNCWEFKGCGRQPGGKREKQNGICPATTEAKLNGIHGGKNAGRACWVVAGTWCGGDVQGSFAQKYKNCELCDFYQTVRREEGANYQISILLLNKLKK